MRTTWPRGDLVYGVAGTLRAVAFDLPRLAVAGTPAPVLDAVVTTATGAADVAVAANGSLVYIRPRPAAVAGRPPWRWIGKDVPHRCRSRPGAYRDSGCRPMVIGWHSPPKRISGFTILPAPR